MCEWAYYCTVCTTITKKKREIPLGGGAFPTGLREKSVQVSFKFVDRICGVLCGKDKPMN